MSTLGAAPTLSTAIEVFLHFPVNWPVGVIDWRAFWLPGLEGNKDPAPNDIVCPGAGDDFSHALYAWGGKDAFDPQEPDGEFKKVWQKDFSYPPNMDVEEYYEPFYGGRNSFDVDGHKNCTYHTATGDSTLTGRGF